MMNSLEYDTRIHYVAEIPFDAARGQFREWVGSIRSKYPSSQPLLTRLRTDYRLRQSVTQTSV